MTFLQAFFVVMFVTGVCYFLYLLGSFIGLHTHHRRIARNRRWARGIQIGFKACPPQEKGKT